MKKLKTNIRYFMQLRQSPSMVLHLQNSKAPQSSHRGTPPRRNPCSSVSSTVGGGVPACPRSGRGKREAHNNFLFQGRHFAPWNQLGVRTWEQACLSLSSCLPFICCVALGKLLYLSESCSL